jgi:uncharacterized OB-fold protein
MKRQKKFIRTSASGRFLGAFLGNVHCYKCGNTLRPDKDFCPQCKKRLTEMGIATAEMILGSKDKKKEVPV